MKLVNVVRSAITVTVAGCLLGLILSAAEVNEPAGVQGIRFYPVSVTPGSSMVGTIYTKEDARATYFDVRFRAPGSNVEWIAENWQSGTSLVHNVRSDTALGPWSVTGIRSHGDPNDHRGAFEPISATLNVTPAQASGFTPVGEMTTSRIWHSATLLDDGRVLIAGGRDQVGSGSGPMATAELFDPVNGTFTRTRGEMLVPRAGHTATLLLNGKVLITGGLTGETLAELYDPAIDAFVPAGRLTDAVGEQQAILLANGQVLITGVTASPSARLPHVELYDPASGSFTRLLWSTHLFSTATLLLDGRVFFANGPSGPPEDRFQQGQLYDPRSGAFTFLGSFENICCPSDSTSATLLADGRVLLAGGGIVGGPVIFSDAAIYEASTNTIRSVSDMTSLRFSHVTTLLPNASVLMVGGEGSGLDTAEVFDPTAGIFQPAGRMAAQRVTGHTVTLLKTGSALVAGGAAGYGYAWPILRTAEIFGGQ